MLVESGGLALLTRGWWRTRGAQLKLLRRKIISNVHRRHVIARNGLKFVSRIASGRAALGRQRKIVGHAGCDIPARRPHRRFCGRGGHSAGERQRGTSKRRKCSPVVPGQLNRPTDTLGAIQLLQRSIGSRKGV